MGRMYDGEIYDRGIYDRQIYCLRQSNGEETRTRRDYTYHSATYDSMLHVASLKAESEIGTRSTDPGRGG